MVSGLLYSTVTSGLCSENLMGTLMCPRFASPLPDAARVMYSRVMLAMVWTLDGELRSAHDDDVQATRDFATLMDSIGN